MKKRITALITVIVMLCSMSVFASANTFTMSINNAKNYKSDNLSGNNLRFYAGAEGTFSITGDTLTEFYYDSDIKYYTFANNFISVRCDKNSFYGDNIAKAEFELLNNGLNVKYTKTNGNTLKITASVIENRYTVTNSSINKYTVAWFGDKYAPASEVKDGKLVFNSSKLGTFSLREFEFSDVSDKSKWYYEYVNLAAVYGILSGVGDNLYKPEKNVTRGQLAAMIVKATEHIISYSVNNSKVFTDVSKTSWYYDYITKCATLGIMDGVSPGVFKPEANATREQIATVTMRLLKIIGSYGDNELPVIDNSTCYNKLSKMYSDASAIQPWAYEAVLFCSKLNIMVGHEQRFRPSANITRAECAKIFYLIYDNIY